MRALGLAAILLLLVLGAFIGALALLSPAAPGDSTATVDILPESSPAAPHVTPPPSPPASGHDGSAASGGGAPAGTAPGGTTPPAGTRPPQNGATAPQGGNMAPQGGSTPPQNGTAPNQSMNTPPVTTSPVTPPPGMAVAPVTPGQAPGANGQTGQQNGLMPAPMSNFIEPSPFGPLPKIAMDGRRPLDIYRRPSAYRAKPKLGGPARVALLVEGIGAEGAASDEALTMLPPEVSFGLDPAARDPQKLVNLARAKGHEVLLEVPMESAGGNAATDPPPNALLVNLPPDENKKRLEWAMGRMTGYVGVTNEGNGSFEAAQDAFEPVLAEIRARGLLYLDGAPKPTSTTAKIAKDLALDYASASVRIMGDESPVQVAEALAKLSKAAKQKGTAIGVAAAKSVTVSQIAQWAGGLHGDGLVLVPVSSAVLSQV